MYEVVVVDDEIAAANLVARHVQKMPEFHVAGVFSDSVMARDYLLSHPTDILITDIRMPVVSGLDLAQCVAEATPGCAVVLVSAYSEFEYAKKAIALGVADYLCKPIRLKELDDGLNAIAARIEQTRAEILLDHDILREEADIFFLDLISGRLCDEAVFKKRFAAMGAPFALTGVWSGILEISMPQAGGNRGQEHIKRVLRKELPEYYARFLAANEDKFYFLMVGCDALTVQTLRLLASRIYHYLALTADVCIAYAHADFIGMAACPLFTQPMFEADPETDSAIGQMKEYILAHLQEDLSRDSMAAMFFLAPAYFSRYFKKHCGVSFYEFMRNARMEKSIALLGEGLQVQEIAERVGYRDRNHFNKVFQQHTGMSPTEFRRSMPRGRAEL